MFKTATADEGANAAFSSLPKSVARRKNALNSGAAPRVAEILLLLLLCIMSARFFWLLFAPLSIADTPPAVVRPVSSAQSLQVKSPFAIMASAEPVLSEGPTQLTDVQETSLNLKLHGVWSDGEKSSAIISDPDGKQIAVRIGDQIWDEVTLEAVYPNQVTINSNGVIESLKLPKDIADRAPEQVLSTENVTAVAQRATIQASLVDVVRFESAVDGFGDPSIALYAASDRRLFDAQGLRDGDILKSVDGKRVSDIADMPNVITRIAGKDSIAIVVERDDIPLRLTLRMRPENELNR